MSNIAAEIRTNVSAGSETHFQDVRGIQTFSYSDNSKWNEPHEIIICKQCSSDAVLELQEVVNAINQFYYSGVLFVGMGDLVNLTVRAGQGHFTENCGLLP